MIKKSLAAALSAVLAALPAAASAAGAQGLRLGAPRGVALPAASLMAAPMSALPALPQAAGLPGAAASAALAALPAAAPAAVPLAAAAAAPGGRAEAPAGAPVPSARAALEGMTQPPRPDAVDPVAALFDGRRTDRSEAEHHALDDKTVNDLELFADGSGLYSLVNRTTTAFGAKRLAWLVRHPYLDAAEIRRRQGAVAALAGEKATRAAADAALEPLREKAGARLASHFEDPPSMRFLAIAANGIQVLLTSFAAMTVHAAGWRGLLQMGMMWLMLGGRPIAEIQKARGELMGYKAAFEAARRLAPALAKSESPELRALAARLDVDGPKADPALAKAAASLRRLQSPKVMALADALWFHGAKTLPFLQRRLAAARAQVAGVLGALAEADAYRALALYGEAHQGRAVMPAIEEGAPRLSIESGHHPFLALKEPSVPNGARFGAGGPTFAVLTGSNMGGKSTYLKMSALLPLLAQIGAPVPAAAMALTPLRLITSIDIRDNLASGKSLYDAETDRALALVRAAQSGPGHLIVMDEILQGTNPEESSAAQWGIVRYLARTPNLFLLATHNPKVTELEGVEPGVANFHVEEKLENGKMTFSHKILPGPAVSRNGLTTLEMKGFPREIVEEARRQVGPKN